MTYSHSDRLKCLGQIFFPVLPFFPVQWPLSSVFSQTLLQQPRNAHPYANDFPGSTMWTSFWNEVQNGNWESETFHVIRSMFCTVALHSARFGRDDVVRQSPVIVCRVWEIHNLIIVISGPCWFPQHIPSLPATTPLEAQRGHKR